MVAHQHYAQYVNYPALQSLAAIHAPQLGYVKVVPVEILLLMLLQAVFLRVLPLEQLILQIVSNKQLAVLVHVLFVRQDII